METKHALKTKVGLKEKKIQELEARLEIEPKSPAGESLKESVRLLVSVIVGMAIASIYRQFPVLGQLQPDQTVLVVAVTAVVVRAIDKFVYQFQKNRGNVNKGTGIDLMFVGLGSLMSRAKTPTIQTKEEKK